MSKAYCSNNYWLNGFILWLWSPSKDDSESLDSPFVAQTAKERGDCLEESEAMQGIPYEVAGRVEKFSGKVFMLDSVFEACNTKFLTKLEDEFGHRIFRTSFSAA